MGDIQHVLHIGGVFEEFFNVMVLVDLHQLRALGFQNEGIDRLVSFPESGG